MIKLTSFQEKLIDIFNEANKNKDVHIVQAPLASGVTTACEAYVHSNHDCILNPFSLPQAYFGGIIIMDDISYSSLSEEEEINYWSVRSKAVNSGLVIFVMKSKILRFEFKFKHHII